MKGPRLWIYWIDGQWAVYDATTHQDRLNQNEIKMWFYPQKKFEYVPQSRKGKDIKVVNNGRLSDFVRDSYRRFLERRKQDILFLEKIGLGEKRKTVCFNCGWYLNSQTNSLCKQCLWIRCPHCGACGCSVPRK